MAAELERITLEIYRRGAALAAERGVLIADTKLEFGRAADGSLMLADEVLTPDSSRFWPADSWVPGRPQHSLDKQFLRDWSATLAWDRTPPGPPIPEEIVAVTAGNVNTAPVSYSATTPSTSPALARLRKSCRGSAGFAGFSGSQAKS